MKTARRQAFKYLSGLLCDGARPVSNASESEGTCVTIDHLEELEPRIRSPSIIQVLLYFLRPVGLRGTLLGMRRGCVCRPRELSFTPLSKEYVALPIGVKLPVRRAR
jgi:hypothetical protein